MTETTTIPAKEDNITPVDPEKKPEVKQEPEAIQPENEVSDSKPEEKVKEIKPIDNGYLLKSSKLLVMKHWSRSYFAFGSEGQTISLPNLKTYHRKNVKRGIPKPSVTGNTSSNAEVKDDEPSKVDESTKVDESKKPDESAKVDESPKVEESKKPDEPPKAEESTSADVVEEVKVDDKPKEDEKVESGKKQVDDKKSPETKDEKPKDEVTVTPYVKKVFENIAHASQTGEGLLFYFKSDTQKSIPHGIINLKDVKEVIALNEHAGKQFAFKIETEYRTFELAAEKEEDRESWIKTIKEKSDKAKESSVVAVDESKFNDIYEKLTKGTAFTGEASRHAGELSDEPFSGDEEIADKSRSTETNKRKSFLPFAFGRKTSTTEHVATIAENTEDVATENTTTEETEENKPGEPKPPQKASKFLSFFNKKPEPTQSTPKADDDKAKTVDETTNAETSNAAAATNGAEHPEVEKKKFNVSDFIKKATTSKETPKDDNKEVASNAEQSEQTENKPETTETPADETTQHKEGNSFFKNIFKKPTGETSETKAETTEPPADVSTTEAAKNDGNKETEETTDTHDAEDKDKTEEKAEPSLVRRVTTKIFGAKRAKSPKADEKKSDSISRDLVDKIEETEEKTEETEETKPTENADATAQTSEQTAEQTTEQTAEQNAEQTAGPESSTEPENKKKEKSSIFNFGRRKSGGVKKENSETQEKAETDGEAVASATEATDVEEPKEEKTEKVEKSGQKAVFPDEKRTKKNGNLLKQTGFITKSLEQRYFVLTDDKKLYYYRTSNDASTQKSIDILKVKIGDGNKFDLETKSRTYKLGAESEEDRESWIQVFKELGFEVESHESTSESKETPKKLDDVVPSGSGNENDIEKSVKDAADKSADTADAKVTEAQETTTQTAKVEESTEEITTVTETTEITSS